MSKQGRAYLRIICITMAAALGLYGLFALLLETREDYDLCTAAFCEVGDGETVSGFVVRSENPLFCGSGQFIRMEQAGKWVGAGQCLALGLGERQTSFTASCSGYFSRVCDGYESLLSPQLLEELTLEEYRGLLAREVTPPPDAYGKLVCSQQWYFVTALPEERAKLCAPGETLTLCLAGGEYPMEILRTSQEAAGELLLILRCNRGMEEVCDLRYAEGRVNFSAREGLLVPKSALYYLNGAAGVYVLEGARARWKALDILAFQGENVLVRQDKSSVRNLWAGDEIIVTSKEIYDGKVMK